MSKRNSTPVPAQAKPEKPAKPYDDFPLFAHATGRWAKKIRGRMVYFGKWDDWQAALDKYNREKDSLHAGRRQRDERPDGATVRDLCNAYWNEKKARLDGGELSPHTFKDVDLTTDLVINHFGKTRRLDDIAQDDFAELRVKLAKRYGAVALGNWIQRVRSVFKYACDTDMLDKARFGPGFKRPTKKTMRLAKAKQGKKLFTADEVRSVIDKAGQPLKAMLLLGVNCGFGNSDCGTLPLAAIDLDRGLLDYPRPKTGVARRCPLWPETVAALREAIAQRPDPADPKHAGLAFITKYGDAWAKDTADNPVSKETRKLLDQLKINGHRNFYTLRHTFQTIGDGAKDPVAVKFIMGHVDSSMSGEYREDVDDERLQAVVEHVRGWLFGKAPVKEEGEGILRFRAKA
ncbi:MAG: site-specific integrase [Gemmataceae bacterium]|nr:site-specific integrase [Gemmataceae bacterium]